MGPLTGLRIIEFAGIGPGPFCAMLLADLGADVLRLDRAGGAILGLGAEGEGFQIVNRGRPALTIDLKHPEAVALVLDLLTRADGLIEGFRPGTMERLGLGPEPCLTRNARLVYGRITGWGQDGPLAMSAGHDLNYIALTGALHSIGRAGQPPTPPLNLLGDYGGGALYLAFGMVCALLEATKSGHGQVVDTAMMDGAASLMTAFYGAYATGSQTDLRGENLLDSGAPFYDVYRCADGRYVAVAAIELKFRSAFYRLAGIEELTLPDAADRKNWPAIKEIIAARIATRSRDEWAAVFEGGDACVSPVLTLAEAPRHPHHVARQSFVNLDGITQPAPAPRFSRTKADPRASSRTFEAKPHDVLTAWGCDGKQADQLIAAGIVKGVSPDTAE